MMKNVSISIARFILATFVVGLIIALGGCGIFAQPGETAAEGHRRHIRNVRLNHRAFLSDLDRAGLVDEPVKATDKRIR